MSSQSNQEVMLQKVRSLQVTGYQFALCWNWNKDPIDLWKRVKDIDINQVPDAEMDWVQAVKDSVKGLFIKEEYGKEYILVFLEKGETGKDRKGRVYPSIKAQKALAHLGLSPIKQKFKATFQDPVLVNYIFAEADEVVKFL